MKHKLLSILLCLAMALSLLPTAALAEETGTPENYVTLELTYGSSVTEESIAAAKAKGAQISTVNQVTFAAPVFVQATGASEPALSGAVSATKAGAFCSHPVKGLAGVYQFQVVKRAKNAATYNEQQQEMKLRQKAMQYAGNYMNELYVNAKVVDNRYLFF